MKKVKLALILIISIFLLSGCFGGEFGDDVFSGISGETYQVSGQITNLQGDPVEDVQVYIDGQISDTDASGFYNLEEVESGSVDVELESNDYRNVDTYREIHSDTSMDFVMVEKEVVYAGRTSGDTSGYLQLKRPDGTGWEYKIYLETLDGETYNQEISFVGGNYSVTDNYMYFLAETDQNQYLMGIGDSQNIEIAALTAEEYGNLIKDYETLAAGDEQITFIQNNLSQGVIYTGETVFFQRLNNEDLDYQFLAEGILNKSNQEIIENGKWILYSGNKGFDLEISYTLKNADGERQDYKFIDYSGGVSSNGDDGFSFALELLEVNSDQSFYVYGLSDDSIIKVAVIEITAESTETFENIYDQDPDVTRTNIENVINNSSHVISGEVTNP